MAELYHHGIKGMKWGVRRTPEQLGHSPGGDSDERKKKPAGGVSKVVGAAKKRAAEGAASRDAQKAAKAEAKKSPAQKAKEIDTAELQARIQRMNLEKQYAQLVAERNPQKFATAKKVLGKILMSTAEDVGTAYATKLLKDMLDIPYKGKKNKDDD